ncbi:tyrosine-type recombinase/integrase [Streptomyces sp. NPDC050698]
MEPRNLNRHFYPIRERLGLDVRFHDLRHTCVTLLLGLGIPPHIVRDIVGHSTLNVTMNIYAHADMTEKRAALDKLGDLLSGERLGRCRQRCRQRHETPWRGDPLWGVFAGRRWRPRQDSNLRPSA